MATKRRRSDSIGKTAHGTPQYPYTTRPNALRRSLKLIPQRPKPAGVGREPLRGWDIGTGGDDYTAVRVLRALGLIDGSGAATDVYERYMNPEQGAAVLGEQVKKLYHKFF